ncbi:uncharacterized protein [Antedon mediterranea]|uniref:uncharacterized protein isoform X2 n=1 Tax=Antedon mediterranea TaxID=105859 RepID=UPI003AF50B51
MSCTPVEVVFEDGGWVVNATEIVLASLLGLIIGVIIALLCLRCFFKELAKDRVQKSSNAVMMEQSTTYRSSEVTSNTVRHLDYDKIPLMKIDNEESDNSSEKTRKRTDSDEEDDNKMENFDEDSQNDKSNSDSLITAIANKTREATERTLILQDIKEVNLLERELQQEKINSFLQLLKIFLLKFASKGHLEKDFSIEFANQYEQDFKNVFVSIEAEQLVAAEHIIANGKSKRDPVEVEEAVEEIRREGARTLDMKFQEYQLKIKDELEKSSDLSEDEVNALMEKLSENMAEVERSLGREWARQASILQERLANRQGLASQYRNFNEREVQRKVKRIEHQRTVLTSLSDESHLTDSQKESILKQYEADLNRVQENHQAEVIRQTKELSSKLEKLRLHKMEKLKKKQKAEERELMKDTSHGKAKDFVVGYHELLEEQRNERNDYVAELDYNEAEKISILRKKLEESCEESIEEQENSFYETLADQARLTNEQVNKLMKKHSKNMKNLEEKNKDEKKRQLERIQEKIANKKAQWMEEQERVEVEQQQLEKQQDRTVHKLLESQSGLDEEARNQILKQHALNMAAINNQMQIARLKQQKILEGKLAKREIYVENLRKNQEEEKEAIIAKGSQTALEKLEKKHEEELNTELKEIEKERQKATRILRDRMASENEAVLKSQDVQLGLLIGKLQVGQSRRQGIIKKNDRAIKELQEQLLETVVENDVSTQKTNSIIKKHMREVEDLQEKMQEAKDKQYRMLKEKVESRMIKKEKAMEYEMNEEKKRQKSASASTSAISIMNKMLLDQRHQQQKKQIENDLKAELVQQQMELNQQLEATLVKELEEREKDFLAQLAAVSNLSKDDLSDVIYSAVSNGGGSEETAHNMIKDFKKRLKSAQTVTKDMEDDDKVIKPKKKGKKKKKILIEDEEDDF